MNMQVPDWIFKPIHSTVTLNAKLETVEHVEQVGI